MTLEPFGYWGTQAILTVTKLQKKQYEDKTKKKMFTGCHLQKDYKSYRIN